MPAKARSSIVCVQGTGISWGAEREDAGEVGGEARLWAACCSELGAQTSSCG